jgi:hypothetical protein
MEHEPILWIPGVLDRASRVVSNPQRGIPERAVRARGAASRTPLIQASEHPAGIRDRRQPVIEMTEVTEAAPENLPAARALDPDILPRTVLTFRRFLPEIDMIGACPNHNREENGLDRTSGNALNRPMPHQPMCLARRRAMSLATPPVALQVPHGEAPENDPTAEARQPLRWDAAEILEGVLNHGAFLKCARRPRVDDLLQARVSSAAAIIDHWQDFRSSAFRRPKISSKLELRP